MPTCGCKKQPRSTPSTTRWKKRWTTSRCRAANLAGWTALLQPLDLFDRAVLLAIAHGLPPLGRDTLDGMARAQGVQPTMSRVRAAIDRLRRSGLLSKAGHGSTAVEDPLFAEFLQSRSLQQLK